MIRTFCVLLCAAALIAAAAPQAPALRDLIWTDANVDRAAVLTHQPSECLARSDVAIETGRALFRSRTLLGGPAARVGLSCSSCHSNGRTNAHFDLPELTDRPGFADVTSEWASRVRGDGVMNPRAIPDLAGVFARAAFGAERETSLQRFVHSVIVDEFQGAAPPVSAERALLAYLAALDPAACGGEEPITLEALSADVRRAYDAARAQAKAGERETAELTLLATQDALARLVERLPARAFRRDRAALELLSRDLTSVRAAPDLAAALDAQRAGWMARFDANARRVERLEARSYANPRVLARALAH